MLLRRVLWQELNVANLVGFTSTSTFRIMRNSYCKERSNIQLDDVEDGGEDGDGVGEALYSDVPRPSKKWERKPYPTSIKVLIRRAKEEKMVRKENPCRVIEHAPDNGLLVPELVDVAKLVYLARESLMRGLSLLLNHHADTISVHRCRFCREVHVGRNGHEIKTCEGPSGASRNASHVWRKGGIRDIVYFPKCYHLYDRAMTPRVGHKERYEVPRLPAVVELCIQAGLDLKEYPTKRRTKPVYSIEGRIVDFDLEEDDKLNVKSSVELTHEPFTSINTSNDFLVIGEETMKEIGTKTLRSWLKMRTGVENIMKKYGVLTCGYCTAIHVGPKGHKVRRCKATGHQYRDGLHAWQESTIDDLIGPNYVWHVSDPQISSLHNELKRYYGKAPAVVELCVQAGALVPREYASMMRLDVVVPSSDEYDLVA